MQHFRAEPFVLKRMLLISVVILLGVTRSDAQKGITVISTECPAVQDLNPGDTAFVIICSALVLLMTPGLGFFYGGMVRKKNMVNTIMMSYSAMGVVVIQWVLFGYSFAFGPGSPVWGNFRFGGLKHVGIEANPDYSPTVPHIVFMNFQMMFAIITPALISGSVVERMSFKTFMLFTFLWTTLVYDPLAHWVWSAYSDYAADGSCRYVKGWLRDMGAIDFAGGLVIHVSAGFSGIVASYFVGKRKSFNPEKGFSPSSVPFVVLGSGMLWFGWLGFNGGSAGAANGAAGLAATNSSIAAAAAFMTWMALDAILKRKTSAVGGGMGIVIGLIAITPASGFILPGFAIIVGGVASIAVYFSMRLKPLLHVDDSLDVFWCHGVAGIVGALMTGLFATTDINPAGEQGAFYGNGKLFGVQLLSVVVAVAISVIGTAVIMVILKYTVGLRINSKTEEHGLDTATHGEKAFEEEQPEGFFKRMKHLRSRSSKKSGSGSDSVTVLSEHASGHDEELMEITEINLRKDGSAKPTPESSGTVVKV